MKPLLVISFAFALSTANGQITNEDLQKYLKNKNEQQLRKLKIHTMRTSPDTSNLDLNEMLKQYSNIINPSTLYHMPVIIEQRPTAGIIPTILVRPPAFGIMPGAELPNGVKPEK